MGKRNKIPQELAALRDALSELVEKLRPRIVPEYGMLEPDPRHAKVDGLPQGIVEAALRSTRGKFREELTARMRRLEQDVSTFHTEQRRFRAECADPVRAMQGVLGRLSDPEAALRALRRGAESDLEFLATPAEAPPTGKHYPQNPEALKVLREAARRKGLPRYAGKTNEQIALALLLDEDRQTWWPIMAKPRGKHADAPAYNPAIHTRTHPLVNATAAKWGGYLSKFINDPMRRKEAQTPA